MPGYGFDLAILWRTAPLLWWGIVTTLELTVVSVAIGTVAGFLLCQVAMSTVRPLRWAAVIYIELFRCTPALVQLIWIFYCVPILFGVVMDPIPMAIVALSLNITAFNAEAYRAAIQSIPRLHIDASEAIGLSSFQRTIFVVLPQALVAAVPVLLTNAIGMLQQTSLVAIVGIADLMYQAKTEATSTYRPIEIFTLAALIYLLIALPISKTVSLLDRRLRRRYA